MEGHNILVLPHSTPRCYCQQEGGGIERQNHLFLARGNRLPSPVLKQPQSQAYSFVFLERLGKGNLPI